MGQQHSAELGDASLRAASAGSQEKTPLVSTADWNVGNQEIIRSRFQTAQAPGQDGPLIIIPGQGSDRQPPIGDHLVDLGKQVDINVTDAQRQTMLHDLQSGHLSPESVKLLGNILQAAAEKGLEGRAGEVMERALNDMVHRGTDAASVLGQKFGTKEVRIGTHQDSHGVTRHTLGLTDGVGLNQYDLGAHGRSA